MPADANRLGIEVEPLSDFVLCTHCHPALDHERTDHDGVVTAWLGRGTPLCSREGVTVAWDPHQRSLRVQASTQMSGPLYLATDGTRVALAPTLRHLARLGWVGNRLDPEGLMFGLGRARLRVLAEDRTVLRNVWRILPGTTREVRRDRHVLTGRAETEQPTPWRGSFEDGVAQMQKLLEADVARDLSRHRSVAVELSGGLDSSALAWLIGRQRSEDLDVLAMMSVAAPGSSVTDDRALAAVVAERFGFPLALVAPDAAADVYCPTDASFGLNEHPLVGPRHYVYEALDHTALAHGATATFNGLAGEFGLTRRRRVMSRRQRLKTLVRRERTSTSADVFHPRVRDHVVGSCPEVPEVRVNDPSSGRRMIGYPAGWERSFQGQLARLDGTARYTPLRNPDVIRLAASFPPSFFKRDGFDRAIVRAMTAGSLPDVVRLRKDKTPFSPDYYLRLRRDAPRALDRIDHHRTTEAANWLDLEWLATALRTIDSASLNAQQAAKIQLTATTAEWFDWWARQTEVVRA